MRLEKETGFSSFKPENPKQLPKQTVPLDFAPPLASRLEIALVVPQLESRYPIDWEERKAAVWNRDGGRCQVTGCPSLCEIDVHHIQPIHENGSHDLANLVCLCLVHHWLLPRHELVAERLAERDRFTMRRAHWRWHPNRRERIEVNASFPRAVPASVQECSLIQENYGMKCAVCAKGGVEFKSADQRAVCFCPLCRKCWQLPTLIAEILGPILGAHLLVTRNHGSFQFDLGLLGAHSLRGAALCYLCFNKTRIGLLNRKINGRNGQFIGCSNYREFKCQNTNQKQIRLFGPDAYQ